MTRVVLFHHAQGLTPGVTAFADQLREAGHEVHTPDLFEGRTFDTIQAGMARVGEIGFGEIMERGARAADALGGDLVYAGFSLGVVPAQMLAQTRPGALGALLCYSCVPVSEFGEAWPAGVPVQIHGMDADPFFVDEGDIDAAREIVESSPDAELFLYPGDQHYFADSSLPSYDAGATALLLERVGEFLEQVSSAAAKGRPAAAWPPGIGAITLFTEDLTASKDFYERAFGIDAVFHDADSVVFRFGETRLNLLAATAAPELIEPARVAPTTAGHRTVFTLQVDDVDRRVAALQANGVELLNGPVDRPWGPRTASFRDPSGHIWEIAH